MITLVQLDKDVGSFAVKVFTYEKAPIMSCSVDDVSNHWQNASDAN
ncbi:hypothetical protein T4A_4040 [Trichinella pseudospiralis]|uniref:Uncharacterized protein n=1 Tax=Trichinella pseudospiralis TaxID=6337 RepID=A0A0V1DSI9_TRIPS|nr:hypothetical protein T4A_4040 [Trichinella pseudospiralis]